MQLKQLKLAGFKSFVDPTVVLFPSQLVAVLGPNGCGKSNIIDAVRWVMGESSAKNLRGESMADVIFNGSSNRKPLGQASVELVFDNSLGRLSGPFASYGEIAVKRVVTRDGDSSYFLNGSRCRRKDITDIFLGTGAGSKGYSIIGQGTISRLIEAKPEELRVFLEEAAGVSKYKERRRETLQRIEHTRDNLTRVADIRDELDKQLQRLERQAKAAERYMILKEEEKRCKAEILALKWKDLNKQQITKQKELQDLVLVHEQQQTLVTHVGSERTVLNERLQEMNEALQQIQASFYQVGTEIARLEEGLLQQEREKKRLEQERQQMQEDWQRVDTQIRNDKEQLEFSQKNAQDLELNVQRLREEFSQQDAVLQEVQHQQAQWEARWQEVQSALHHTQKELQITEIGLNHTQQRRNETTTRLEKLALEQSSHSIDELIEAKRSLEEKQFKLKETQEFDAQQFSQSQDTVSQCRTQLKETETRLTQLQDQYVQKNTELAALSATQKAAAETSQTPIQNWAEKSRLFDVLQVESRWQKAIELVLGDGINAYVLEEFEMLWPEWENCLISQTKAVTLKTGRSEKRTKPTLADKLNGPLPASAYVLESIYTAQNLDEALSWLPELSDNESIVLEEGGWIGKGWVKFACSKTKDDIGFLARQKQIVELTGIVAALKQEIEETRISREESQAQLDEHLRYQELFQLNLNGSNEALRINQNTLQANEQAILQAQKIIESMVLEREELLQLLEEFAERHMTQSEQLEQLRSQLQEREIALAQYHQEKEQWSGNMTSHKQKADEVRSGLYQAELNFDREQNQVKQLKERIEREQERLLIVQERLEALAEQCLKSDDPGSQLRSQLNEQLQKHNEIETVLTDRREQLAQTKMQFDDLEKSQFLHDSQLKKIHESITQTRMDEQALAVRSTSMEEALAELGQNTMTVLQGLDEAATQNQREEQLLELTDKIKRLGAINLAAIEEFTTEQQRKQYLDEQYNDLNQALAALETAIEKMDDETRTRLESTFDEVNTSFKSLFPRLFGGGRAELQLTCENLLEAGIVVMAQPPGKRNSTIHLLSGGEKAMTAVALVFAIFQLNPSPFCMLDEVDAPLDDVNVGRFCDLVKEMSQFVQFLFITHNKVTMELADHLIGVTMREPGVSRLVAVDVEQALTLE